MEHNTETTTVLRRLWNATLQTTTAVGAGIVSGVALLG